MPFARRLAAGALLLSILPLVEFARAAPASADSPQPPLAPPGYWLVAADGGIFPFSAPYDGSTGAMTLNKPIVGMAGVPDGGGYWLVGADGGIFGFGDAGFFGSTGAVRLNQPIVGMASTPTGRGYWLVAADGGIFAFGDAGFFGSTGGIRLNQPIVGMASTPTGRGYWLVAADGGIFAFGDAGFFGSTGELLLNKPIVGMSATKSGKGYWLAASDGGIFAFGDARYFGSTGSTKLNQPIVAMGATPDAGGYWLAASDGGMFAFGDAPFLGSMGGRKLNKPIVGLAIDRVGDPYPSGTTGYDISFPQCGSSYPPPPYRVTVVGVNGGRPYTPNPCLASEAAWAGASLTLYVNTGPLIGGSANSMNGPAGACAQSDVMCEAYNWGWNGAIYDVAAAAKAGIKADVWWLDVEMANGWCGSDPPNCTANGLAQNDRVIQGTIDGLRSQGEVPGIYGTSLQWGLIAGASYQPQVPLWVAGASGPGDAPKFCDPSNAFAGGQAWITQWTGPIGGGQVFDQDYAC